MPSSSSLPSGPRRSPGSVESRRPSSQAPCAAARDPLLARAEVVDVAEEDVGHRGAVGDRDRDRVVRQAALGVERAVDRVDDDERVGAAEVDRPALLADRREAQRPRRAGRRAASNTASSAAASISSVRSPPSPRVPDLAHALGGGGLVAQDAAQRARRAAADAQPVGVPRGIGGSHRAYPTVVSPTPRQLEAIAHAGRPAARARRRGHRQDDACCASASPGWSREGGLAPESILVLTVSDARRGGLRERLETRLDGGFDELDRHDRRTTSARGCCTTRRSRPGSTRSPPRSPPADRLAMLLERIDELPLASHDLRGNPSALLGSIVGRIDRLKDELVSHEDYAAWAGTLGAERRPRARVRRPLRRPTTGMLAEAGTLDFGDLAAARLPAPAHAAARAGAGGRALPPRARRRAAGRDLRPGPADAAARGRARPGQRRRRRRPGDPPLPRRGGEEPARLRGRVARRDGRAARGQPPLPGARS